MRHFCCGVESGAEDRKLEQCVWYRKRKVSEGEALFVVALLDLSLQCHAIDGRRCTKRAYTKEYIREQLEIWKNHKTGKQWIKHKSCGAYTIIPGRIIPVPLPVP